jgi:O-Antigen ligase
MHVAATLLGLYTFLVVVVPPDAGVDLGGFVLTPMRLLLVGILVAALPGILGSRTIREREVLAPVSAWAIFLVSVLVGTWASPLGSHYARVGSLVVEGALLWLIVFQLGRQGISLARVEAGLVLGSVLLAVAALASLAYLTLSGAPTVPTDLRFGYVRQAGSFTAPLFFGIWLVAASVLAVRYADRFGGWRRQAAIAAWLVIAAAIVTTGSRVSMIGVLGIAGVYLGMRRRYLLGALACSATLVVAVGFTAISQVPASSSAPSPASPAPTTGGVGVPAPPETGGPVPDQSQAPEPDPRPGTVEYESVWLAGSNRLRGEAVSLTIESLRARPLLGWGVLNAQPASNLLIGHVNYVDSSYLLLLIETGLLGSIGMALVLVTYLRAAWSTLSSPEGLARGLALAALLALSAVAAFLGEPQGYALLALVAGLACATPRSPLSLGLPRPRPARAGR